MILSLVTKQFNIIQRETILEEQKLRFKNWNDFLGDQRVE